MKINLTNQEQKTITISGKKYSAERCIRDFGGSPKNTAGNVSLIDGQLEMAIHDQVVVIRDILGNQTILTR